MSFFSSRGRVWAVVVVMLLAGVAGMCLRAPGAPATASSDGAEEKITIAIDPGHGGKDSGTGEGSRPEAYYNMRVARALQAALEADGRFEVVLTHDESLPSSVSLSLMERAMIANDHNADFLISCHFDGSSDTSPHGVSAYGSVVPAYSTDTLANSILAKTSAATGMSIYKGAVQHVSDHGDTLYYWSDELNWSLPSRPEVGALGDYYGIIKWSSYMGIPALIVEHGFLSNPSDRALIEQESTLQALGEADAAAIIEYYTNHTHSYGALSRDFPSNCMMQGKNSRRCTICGARTDVTLRDPDPDNHIWLESLENSYVAPTCTTEGWTEYTCEITRAMNVGKEGWCENHKKAEPIPALGHAYAITASSPPGHAKDGYISYRCTRCGDSYTETIPGEPHTFVQTATVEPSCEAPGEVISVCSCGQELREPFGEPLGHDYALISETPPACLIDGSRVYRCTRCGAESTETLPATGHTPGETFRREPTCTAEGAVGYTCSVCGAQVITETLALLPHAEVVTGEVPPTCTADGNRTYTCTVCGAVREEVLPATGHTLSPETIITTPGDCVTDATQTGVCAVCGETVTTVTTPAPGHTEGEPFFTPPTCLDAGRQGYICAVCGAEVLSREIPATGHTFAEDAAASREPTCEEEGLAVQVCTVCRERVETPIPALGHDFSGEGGVCVRCGAAAPDESSERHLATSLTAADGKSGTGTGSPGGGAEPKRKLPLALSIILIVLAVLGGGAVLFFTGRKVGQILRKMAMDEHSGEDEGKPAVPSEGSAATGESAAPGEDAPDSSAESTPSPEASDPTEIATSPEAGDPTESAPSAEGDGSGKA